jgi:serine/threonine protein kinase
MIHGKEIIQSETNMDQLHKLLSICGYPTQNSREYLTLKKLGVDDNNNPSKLEELTENISEPTKNILISMLSNVPNERPTISVLLENLSRNNFAIRI